MLILYKYEEDADRVVIVTIQDATISRRRHHQPRPWVTTDPLWRARAGVVTGGYQQAARAAMATRRFLCGAEPGPGREDGYPRRTDSRAIDTTQPGRFQILVRPHTYNRVQKHTKGPPMLLRRLSTPREATKQPVVRYNPERSVSQVWEDGRWINSWMSTQVAATKKNDIETGEDQKGQ